MADQKGDGEFYIISSDGVHWIIPNFFNLPKKSNYKITSPKFHFANAEWNLYLFPNGDIIDPLKRKLVITALTANSDVRSRTFRIGTLGKCKERNFVRHEAIHKKGKYFQCCTEIRFPYINFLHNLTVPEGKLHVFFGIENRNSKRNSVTQFEIDYEKEKEEFKEKHGDSCSGEDIQSEKQTGIVKLKQDLKNILVNEIVSDVILKVHGEEYKAHKCILAARSPVFLAMMTHKTKEKNSGIIDIQDADPKIIPEILNYFYTGSVENLTAENALKMYTFADKYQVDELKESCMLYMLTNISVEGFCDVFCLALRHNEKELKEACIEFFAEKSLDIVSTLKWQTFLSENPIIGNELFIKYMKLSNQR